MTTPAFTVAADVRAMMNWTTTTGQYTDSVITGNIQAASVYLERETHRWFMNRPATTWVDTSNGRAALYIPGFRTITGVSIQGATLTLNGSYWPLFDPFNTIYIGIQLRPFTAGSRDPGRPWLANREWFDRNLDSPWNPANYGGGYGQSSLPNDIVVTGDGGYADADWPPPLVHAAKVLAAFYTARPASLLAETSITPAGGVLTYADAPDEVRAFIRNYAIGTQAVSVG